jgi:hypothetical protein
MNRQAIQLLDHSREAVAYLRRAGGHPKLAALVGASSAAVAVGTVYVMRHYGRTYADVLEDEQPYRVTTLEELQDDDQALESIQRELLAEWGPFAPRDIDDMRRMAHNAGRFIFAIQFYEDGELGPVSGVLQTGLVDAGGDPARLQSAYPTFDAITGGGSWETAASMRGDTAALLQITAFGDRSKGVGSRLRDTALHMLPPSVRYALTTTPVPEGFDLESDPETSPATRFHFRGGARPAGYAPGFKLPAVERAAWPAGRQNNHDVVFMRYTRREDGDWEGVARPDLRLHHAIELPQSLRPRPIPIRRALRRLRQRPASQEAAAA